MIIFIIYTNPRYIITKFFIILFYIKKAFPDAISRYKEIFDNSMELDVYIPSLEFAIEYDGIAWHNSKDSDRKERIKYDYCKRKGIMLLRVKCSPCQVQF